MTIPELVKAVEILQHIQHTIENLTEDIQRLGDMLNDHTTDHPRR